MVLLDDILRAEVVDVDIRVGGDRSVLLFGNGCSWLR